MIKKVFLRFLFFFLNILHLIFLRFLIMFFLVKLKKRTLKNIIVLNLLHFLGDNDGIAFSNLFLSEFLVVEVAGVLITVPVY